MSRLRVLRALLEDAASPHYGLELIRSSGVSGGGLYPILAKLEADGWIVGEWEAIDEAAAGRRKRRYYRMTGLGETEARAVLIDAANSLTLPGPGVVGRPGFAPS
jgi:PadR family transcriptional regulator PadR